jgi:long-chain acyl-CoA synthetase
VDDDGQLLVRGQQVFLGYWRDEAASRAVLATDGWLSTGDLGEIDEEGFVRVTGRRKEIIVTVGGKNVAPARLEDRIRTHDLVNDCMVVGDGRPFIAALVTLDADAVSRWAQRLGKVFDMARLARDPDLSAEIQSAVDEANASVSRAEAIRRFAVLTADWTEEGGQLTPSLKLRRHVVARRHHAEIEQLYDA